MPNVLSLFFVKKDFMYNYKNNGDIFIGGLYEI